MSLANVTGAGGWTTALGRARDFVNQLTLDEKVYMVTGVTGYLEYTYQLF